MSSLIQPTAAEILRVVPTLRSAQFGRIVREVLGLDRDSNTTAKLSPRLQLKVYLYEWLHHLGFLGADQIRWLLKTIDGYLDVIEPEIVASWPQMCYPYSLIIFDRRFALVTVQQPADHLRFDPGDHLHFDLDEELEVELSPETVLVTHIGVDLPALFTVKQRWLKQYLGDHPREPGPQLAGAEPQSPP